MRGHESPSRTRLQRRLGRQRSRKTLTAVRSALMNSRHYMEHSTPSQLLEFRHLANRGNKLVHSKTPMTVKNHTIDSMLHRILFIVVLASASASCAPDESPPEPAASPEFVGSSACESCHQQEFALWRGSHHQLAMQDATSESVLGDFSGITIPYFESSATFFERDDRFLVAMTDENDGSNEYEVTHTFGVTPLQQYLVDLPGGRKQALHFTWDSRPRDEGGQRWYHLYPDEYIDSADPLHWAGRFFNWNYMCAECHSTNLVQGYDLESNAFETTYSEVSVGCEACHGPGSRHVDLAGTDSLEQSSGFPIDFHDRAGAAWIMNPETGIAERSPRSAAANEPEACGRCHSRRSAITDSYEYGKPMANSHMLSLLEEGLYHPDGRILDEVYVYGSFIQSRMYAAGVTCSDCHDPHSGELRAGPNPNDTCATCHLASQFATAEHGGEPVGDCVTCHMTAKTYMGVDDRRDHSFRLPGTDEDADHYGAAIAKGRAGNSNSALIDGIANQDFPGIARATMLSLLQAIDDPSERSAVLEQLDDADPLVRIGALRALRGQMPELRMQHGSHLLRDAVRAVRIEAALTYVDYRDLLPIEDSRGFQSAANDYRKAMTVASAMPEPALNLAEFERKLGNTATAAKLYEHALRVGEDLPLAHHAYGLQLIRSGESNEALEHLSRAVELDSSDPQFVYVYGVALNSLGRQSDALETLTGAYDQFPNNFDIGWALATIHRDAGERSSAREIARSLIEISPNDERAALLLDSLEE